MRAIATIIGNEVYDARGFRLNNEAQPPHEPRAVAVQEPIRKIAPLDPIDEFNAHLAAAIRVAQGMTEQNKRRASEFMEAARGMLTAVTRLKPDEQRRFEQALRNAAR